jgi:hypothetical protein
MIQSSLNDWIDQLGIKPSTHEFFGRLQHIQTIIQSERSQTEAGCQWLTPVILNYLGG